jgi:hypothetical protein
MAGGCVVCRGFGVEVIEGDTMLILQGQYFGVRWRGFAGDEVGRRRVFVVAVGLVGLRLVPAALQGDD